MALEDFSEADSCDVGGSSLKKHSRSAQAGGVMSLEQVILK